MNMLNMEIFWNVLTCLALLIGTYQVTCGPMVNTLKQRMINGKLVTCYTIQCTKNQYFEPCSENNGHDTCHRCPSGYFNKVLINSVDWEYALPPKGGFCEKLDCDCTPESVPDINNTCLTTGIKKCVCNLAENQYGDDYQKCNYFNGTCLAGTELNNDGHCKPCKDGYFKSHHGKGLCIQHNVCHPPHQEVDFRGNKTSDVTCRPVLKNTTATLIYPEKVSPPHIPVNLNVTTVDPVKVNNNSNKNNTKDIKTDIQENITNSTKDTGILIVIIISTVVVVIGITVAVAINCFRKHLGGRDGHSKISVWFSSQYNRLIGYCLRQNISERNSLQQHYINYHPVENQTLEKVPYQESTELLNNKHDSKQGLDTSQRNGYLEHNGKSTNQKIKDAGVQASVRTDNNDESVDPYKEFSVSPLSSLINLPNDPARNIKEQQKAGSDPEKITNQKKVAVVKPSSQTKASGNRAEQVTNNGASSRILATNSPSSFQACPFSGTTLLPPADPLHVDSFFSDEKNNYNN
ncbi:hypothetical protein KUTeg_002369 [Tegillarca granosa]|uniref:Uncharacterized protein n=1 Tax=Tegillarca granosa TaxID=220873 RepID=A0ABQ9FU45_TEGGR|nr:hypothetical protein KUTeg_002369 [Tegillarca granosa]